MKTDDLIAELGAKLKADLPDEIPDGSSAMVLVKRGRMFTDETVNFTVHSIVGDDEEEAYILQASIELWKSSNPGW